MKKILFFLFISSVTFAQSLPKGFAPNERENGFLKSIGITENPYHNRSVSANISTEHPTEDVRTMAEWEEIQALTITWSTDYNIQEEAILTQIVENAIEQAQVVIVCDDENTVESYLQNQGINTENVSYIKTDFNNIWIRDYGQNTCIDYLRKKKLPTFSIDAMIEHSEGSQTSIDIPDYGDGPRANLCALMV